jgi:adenylate cyclase
VRAHGNALLLQLTADREQALLEATRAAARAVELDPTDPAGYGLRGFLVMQSTQHDRYPAALSDVRRAHEMNPNDPTVLRYLGALEAGIGEPEQGIGHLRQALRLSPRQSRSHEIHQILAYACFVAKKYEEGITWALKAMHDMPLFAFTHVNLVQCLVGAGQIDEAKAAFSVGQKVAPALFKSRLEGASTTARPEDTKRSLIFLRIAAGLEDPSVANAVR